jgi:hypothetical protein
MCGFPVSIGTPVLYRDTLGAWPCLHRDTPNAMVLLGSTAPVTIGSTAPVLLGATAPYTQPSVPVVTERDRAPRGLRRDLPGLSAPATPSRPFRPPLPRPSLGRDPDGGKCLMPPAAPFFPQRRKEQRRGDHTQTPKVPGAHLRGLGEQAEAPIDMPEPMALGLRLPCHSPSGERTSREGGPALNRSGVHQHGSGSPCHHQRVPTRCGSATCLGGEKRPSIRRTVDADVAPLPAGHIVVMPLWMWGCALVPPQMTHRRTSPMPCPFASERLRFRGISSPGLAVVRVGDECSDVLTCTAPG